MTSSTDGRHPARRCFPFRTSRLSYLILPFLLGWGATGSADRGTGILSVDAPASRALLEAPSRPVIPAEPGLHELLDRMERAAEAAGGDGLAAVQLGIPVRAVILRRRDREGGRRFQVFLNPEVVSASRETVGSFEHCLSIPWGYRYTERPRDIRVRYLDRAGKSEHETLNAGEAAVFQQELDHLAGILLNTHLPRAAFIPESEMDAFMAPILRSCRSISAADCDRLMKAAWEARVAQAERSGR